MLPVLLTVTLTIVSISFNPFCTNGVFFLGCNDKRGMVHCLYRGVTGYHFKIILHFFLSLKVVFVLANNADPGEMPRYAAFHPFLHCLPNYALNRYQYKRYIIFFYGLPHFKGLEFQFN